MYTSYFGARVNGTVTSTSAPTEFFISTGSVNDSDPFASNSVRLLVNSTGSVGIGTTSPNSILNVNGSLSTAYVAKTANYTATISDYAINCTANTFQITLPTAVGITGRNYIIKNSGTGVITVGTTSSQTIDGATTYSLGTQYKYVHVVSDGANWIITANN